jgi:hypothetical protein
MFKVTPNPKKREQKREAYEKSRVDNKIEKPEDQFRFVGRLGEITDKKATLTNKKLVVGLSMKPSYHKGEALLQYLADLVEQKPLHMCFVVGDAAQFFNLSDKLSYKEKRQKVKELGDAWLADNKEFIDFVCRREGISYTILRFDEIYHNWDSLEKNEVFFKLRSKLNVLIYQWASLHKEADRLVKSNDASDRCEEAFNEILAQMEVCSEQYYVLLAEYDALASKEKMRKQFEIKKEDERYLSVEDPWTGLPLAVDIWRDVYLRMEKRIEKGEIVRFSDEHFELLEESRQFITFELIVFIKLFQKYDGDIDCYVYPIESAAATDFSSIFFVSRWILGGTLKHVAYITLKKSPLDIEFRYLADRSPAFHALSSLCSRNVLNAFICEDEESQIVCFSSENGQKVYEQMFYILTHDDAGMRYQYRGRIYLDIDLSAFQKFTEEEYKIAIDGNNFIAVLARILSYSMGAPFKLAKMLIQDFVIAEKTKSIFLFHGFDLLDAKKRQFIAERLQKVRCVLLTKQDTVFSQAFCHKRSLHRTLVDEAGLLLRLTKGFTNKLEFEDRGLLYNNLKWLFWKKMPSEIPKVTLTRIGDEATESGRVTYSGGPSF